VHDAGSIFLQLPLLLLLLLLLLTTKQSLLLLTTKQPLLLLLAQGMNGLFSKLSCTEIRSRPGICAATQCSRHCHKVGLPDSIFYHSIQVVYYTAWV
jgi:hypothetical protein